MLKRLNPHLVTPSPYHLVIVLLLLTGCGRDADAWDTIQETGVLRVGLDPTYPPFAAATESDLFGFDVDLARALADDLGVQGVVTGRLDGVWHGREVAAVEAARPSRDIAPKAAGSAPTVP